jgi:hypothetical protein
LAFDQKRHPYNKREPESALAQLPMLGAENIQGASAIDTPPSFSHASDSGFSRMSSKSPDMLQQGRLLSCAKERIRALGACSLSFVFFSSIYTFMSRLERSRPAFWMPSRSL